MAKITFISVEGYKSLGKEIKIPIRPLTVLAGVNSSGKSSLFQPFLLLKQTTEVPSTPQGILLNGPNIKVYDAKKLITEGKAAIKVGFYFDNGKTLKNTYKYKDKVGLCLSQSEVSIKKFTETISEKSTPKMIAKVFSHTEEDLKFWKMLSRIASDDKSMRPFADIHRGFFDIEFRNKGKKRGFSFEGGGYSELAGNAKRFVQFLHVPGIRGNPERNYKVADSVGHYVGRFEDYMASIINKWQHSEDVKDKEKLRSLIRFLKRMSLTTSISAQKIDDAFISLKVGTLPNVNNKAVRPINIADVGFGVSQVLPILVALLEAKTNQAVYIEQPELHLHPQAQIELAEILSEFAKKGTTVIFETHSSLMLTKIQTLVAKNMLSEKDVSFNWFSMNSNGLTKVTTAKLDKKGRFGNWPQDFDDVYLQLESEYIESVTHS